MKEMKSGRQIDRNRDSGRNTEKTKAVCLCVCVCAFDLERRDTET